MRLRRLLPTGPLGVRVLWSLAAAGVFVFAGAKVAGQAGELWVATWVLAVVLLLSCVLCVWRAVAVGEDRLAWWMMAVAVGTWAGAEIANGVWISNLDPVPYPSIADALWLADYPASTVALALMLRRRSGRVPPAFTLDGLIGAVSVLALAVLAIAALPTGGATHMEVLVNTAYPAGDLLLCVLLAGAFTLGSFRVSRTWVLLAVSFGAQVISDGVYLQQVAAGTYVEGGLTDVGWYIAPVALAAAAWCRDGAGVVAGGRWRSLVVGTACGLGAVALLLVDHFTPLPDVTVALAALVIALVLTRLGLVFLDHQQLLDRAQDDARTDALTELGNRRALLADLEDAVFGTGVLALFDLDGFKTYNDTYGHPAGDELLRRLGGRLADVAALEGATAYRLGGDEFCLLAPGHSEGGALRLVELGRRALVDAGDGFAVGASAGWCLLPSPLGSSAALADADGRMYAAKHGGRVTAARQTATALLAAVAERHPDLGDHVGEVADLAVAVALELGLDARSAEIVRGAAELHDVGKLAIPDTIINKPGPLDDEEWRFMRRHTLIGERIVQAAPDLRAVAPLVRASHERWDGGGYPDGTAGAEIPLGARIVAVCDAFDAMVANRPYRTARTRPEALAELQRCAGGQFDPVVVEAFTGVLARVSSPA